ncbi:MAG: type II toxin-antitoxin system VapC family toxin, partial [Flexistipes sinusarabici]
FPDEEPENCHLDRSGEVSTVRNDIANKYASVLNIIDIKNSTGLDFDDSYQYCICKEYNLTLVTMDKDFYNIKDIDILFL